MSHLVVHIVDSAEAFGNRFNLNVGEICLCVLEDI